uniref:Tetraspanin-2-like n=1 Tax=Nelumbo nucifera TaxID=4432 RepID=A0A822ZZK9_NELNU|nr:TPA_asm: hypothetical protein HUJ06_018898 [Nelumbo nucifera]
MGVFFQYSKRKPNHLRIWKETCFTHLPFPLSGPRFPVLKWRLKSKAPLPIPNPPLKILCLSSHQIPSFSFLSVFSELQRYNSKRKRPAMAVSNNIIAILNFLALLCSIPIIGTGIWLASKPDNECVHYFRWPVVLIGVLILLVSLAGFVGAYWNRQCLLAFYIFCMAVLIVLLLALLVLAFVVTRPDGSYVVPRRGYKEYRLEGFSSWLRSHVTGSANWGKIRTCLANSNVCSKLSQDYITVDQFFMAHISPLQASPSPSITYLFCTIY